MRRCWLAVLVLVAGCALTHTVRSSGDHPLRVAADGTCPSSLDRHDGVRNTGAGLAGKLVPGSPTALLICRYSPVAGRQAPSEAHGALYGSQRVDAADAVAFARLLNAIPADHAEHTCPADVERFDVLAFAENGRADIDVWSSSSGCWSFTNGARHTGASSTALESYMGRLQQAVPGESEVTAGAGGARGTIRGRLLASGMSARPLIGKVTVHPGDLEPIPVAADGIFAVTLPPGTYTLTGLSPFYNGGRGVCRADGPVDVVSGGTVSANVYCLEK